MQKDYVLVQGPDKKDGTANYSLHRDKYRCHVGAIIGRTFGLNAEDALYSVRLWEHFESCPIKLCSCTAK